MLCYCFSDYYYNIQRQFRFPGDGSFDDGQRRDKTYKPTLEDEKLIQSLPIESKDEHRLKSGFQGEDFNRGYPDEYSRQRYGAPRSQYSGGSELDSSSWNYNQEYLPNDANTAQHEDTESRGNVLTQDGTILADENPMDSKINLPGSIQQDSEIYKPEEKAVNEPQRKVMVKGEVRQVSADIDQESNPGPQYDNVKEFFKSQQDSSIVEVPKTVQRDESMEISKHHFIPVGNVADEVEKEQGLLFLRLVSIISKGWSVQLNWRSNLLFCGRVWGVSAH